jgi:hypothetical protein
VTVRACIATVLVAQLVGCSLLTMQKPSGTRDRDPDCVVSLAPPIVDGLIAGGIVTSLVSAELDPQTKRQATPGVDVFAGVMTLAFLGSGAFGLHRRSLCRDAYAEHDRYLAEQPAPAGAAPRAPTPHRSPAARMAGLTVVVVVLGALAIAGLVAAIDSSS